MVDRRGDPRARRDADRDHRPRSAGQGLTISALLAALLAAATPATTAGLPGVWQGTVGDLPVRACFVSREWATFGAYYYLSRRRLISLESEEQAADAFREGGSAVEDGPLWTIERVDGDRLTARWIGSGRALPVRLTRVAFTESDEGEGACGSLAFHAPRLEGVRTVSSRDSVDGVAFTKIALDPRERFDVGIETFALDVSGAAVARINTALGEGLAGDPPQWLQCMQDSLRTGPFEGSLFERLAPVMITGQWLSVAQHWDGYCGGAHPSSSNSWRLFDLASGAEIELHDWFNDRAVHREHLQEVDEDISTLQPAFRDVVLSGWRADDGECDEVVRSAEFWNLGLTRQAIIFSPSLPHVAQACGDEFVVPFDRLRPFLTDEGAAHVRALSAEAAVRP